MHGDEINVSGVKGYSIPVTPEKKTRKQASSRETASGLVSLDPRLHALQQLVSDLTAPFISYSVERIDTEIRDCIQKIVVLLDLDRGYLSQFSDQSQGMLPTHFYETSSAQTARSSRKISVPSPVMERIVNRECVIISRMADMPQAMKKAGTYFEIVGTKSHFSLPLAIDGIVIGCLSFASTRAEIAWPEELPGILRPMVDTFALSVERKRKKLEVLERIRFETLISDISASFVAAEPEDVDREIVSALELIGGHFGCDRCGMLSVRQDLGEVRVSHIWCSEGVNVTERSDVNLAPLFPWAYEKLVMQGQAIWKSRLEDLPPEAEKDRESWVREGVTSFVNIPLFSGTVVKNMLVIQNVQREREFEKYVQRLRLIGEIFTNALENKKTLLENREKQREINERAQFEYLLADISACFVNLEPDELDTRIQQSLEKVGNFFNGDRCGILEVDPDSRSIKVIHGWYAEGLEQVSKDVNLAPLFPWSYERLVLNGEVVSISNLDDFPPEAGKDRETTKAMGVRSKLNIPLSMGKKTTNILVFNDMKAERTWPEEYIQRMRLLGEIFVSALMRRKADLDLRKSFEMVRELKDKLLVEAEFLRSEIRSCHGREEIVGQSEALSKVLTLAAQVAPTDTSVLICGETGTGKELIAKAIHDMSLYRDKLMVKVNCATLPSTLVESELFGREKGAYTGALTRQIGRFEMANGSTIFLDEIAELPLELQAKLLRVLQEQTFERLGCPKTIQVHVRVIAATNRDITEMVNKGTFREDLYYRLNVFPITVPPLRERIEDIPMLVWAFLNEFCERMGKPLLRVRKRDMELLKTYEWHGNIRELRNIIEHAVIVSSGDTLKITLPQDSAKGITWSKTLHEVECQHIVDVLRHTGGRIKGEGGAAKILGMIPSTLTSRMKKLGIRFRNE